MTDDTAVELRMTPTVLLNGWRFSTVPRKEDLAAPIDRILAGGDPSPSVQR